MTEKFCSITERLDIVDNNMQRIMFLSSDRFSHQEIVRMKKAYEDFQLNFRPVVLSAVKK